MEIDFEKFDELTEMEKNLERLLKYAKLSEYSLSILNYKNQILLTLTILSILYKEYIYNEYLIEQLGDIKPDKTEILTNYNYIIEDRIEELDKCLQEKDLEEADEIINTHGEFIDRTIKKYYARKNKNYILEYAPLEIITEKKVIDFIRLNPFAINQYLNYKALNEQEKIICDILGYYEVCENDFALIKKLMIKNYNKEKLKKAILFILSNTYQEIMEDKTEKDAPEIKFIIESERIKDDVIVDFFIENDNFSSKYIEYFILYNIGIKQGRLEELETKTSYKHVKKRIMY